MKVKIGYAGIASTKAKRRRAYSLARIRRTPLPLHRQASLGLNVVTPDGQLRVMNDIDMHLVSSMQSHKEGKGKRFTDTQEIFKSLHE